MRDIGAVSGSHAIQIEGRFNVVGMSIAIPNIDFNPPLRPL